MDDQDGDDDVAIIPPPTTTQRFHPSNYHGNLEHSYEIDQLSYLDALELRDKEMKNVSGPFGQDLLQNEDEVMEEEVMEGAP